MSSKPVCDRALQLFPNFSQILGMLHDSRATFTRESLVTNTLLVLNPLQYLSPMVRSIVSFQTRCIVCRVRYFTASA